MNDLATTDMIRRYRECFQQIIYSCENNVGRRTRGQAQVALESIDSGLRNISTYDNDSVGGKNKKIIIKVLRSTCGRPII